MADPRSSSPMPERKPKAKAGSAVPCVPLILFHHRSLMSLIKHVIASAFAPRACSRSNWSSSRSMPSMGKPASASGPSRNLSSSKRWALQDPRGELRQGDVAPCLLGSPLSHGPTPVYAFQGFFVVVRALQLLKNSNAGTVVVS